MELNGASIKIRSCGFTHIFEGSFSHRSEIMKCSRVLVAVVAVLCLVSLSSAATIIVTETNGARVDGYTTYTAGLGQGYIGDSQNMFHYGQFSSSELLAALADPSVTIVSATLHYNRTYTDNPGVQLTMVVGEPLYDYTLDTGTDYHTAYHMQFIGGNREAPLLMASRTCSQAEVLYGDSYDGAQSVDVTAIVQDWKAGAASYGCSLGFQGVGSTYENFYWGGYTPYLEVVTAPAPEPVTMGLLAVGGIATLLRRRNA
jgi:hypothetical protein